MADPKFANAFDISNHVIEALRVAYQARDFSAYAERFVLPATVETMSAEKYVETREDLKLIFERVCHRFDIMGVIEHRRRTTAARFVDESLVQSTYIWQVVLPGYVMSDEVVVHSTLERLNGLWRVAKSRIDSKDPNLSNILLSRSRL